MGATPGPPADDGFERLALDPRAVRYSQRRLLNRLSLLVALLLVLVTSPDWLSLGRQGLARLFPPPPYRGTSVYLGTQYGFLLALRSSDGAVRWRTASNAYDGEVRVAAGSVLTVEHVARGPAPAERVVALWARDGRVRWMTPPTAQAEGLLGTRDGLVVAVESPLSRTATPGPPTVLAYDAASGRPRWRYQSAAPPVYAVVLEPGTVYVAATPSEFGPVTLTALDLATGRPRWRIQHPGQIIAASASLVYIAGPSSLDALDAATGVTRWRAALGAGETAAVVGALAVVGSPAGQQSTPSEPLRAYDATTGAPRWQRDGASLLWQAVTEVEGLPASAPLLVATERGYAGLDAATGAARWQGAWPSTGYAWPGEVLDGASFVDPVVGDGRYYWCNGKAAVAMASDSGAIRWLAPVPYQAEGASDVPRVTSASYAGGTLYCAADDQLFALDGGTGRARWGQVSGAGGVTALEVGA